MSHFNYDDGLPAPVLEKVLAVPLHSEMDAARLES